MAALLLTERVVTLLPGQGSGRGKAERAAERLPSYMDFVLSWQWSVPLWEAGVVSGLEGGQSAEADVRAAHARIASEERFERLRGLMRPGLLETDEAYLEAVARDLLRGGPDPAITVPLAAGMDAFAIRCGASVARSHPTSVVQVAESRLGRRLFAVAAPVLLQAGAADLLAARAMLEDELTELRLAIGGMTNPALRTNGHERMNPTDRLASAAASYARAFDRQREELLAGDPNEPRIVDGVVAITGMTLPPDAVYTASLAALGAASGPRDAAGGGTAIDKAHVLTLLIKVMGRVPASRR